MRKLVLYISMSIDGYLATKNDEISWLSIVEKKGEDYGYQDFYKDVDTYIVGKTTYDTILKLTGGVLTQAQNLDCYVITRQNIDKKEGVKFYNGDLETLILKLKSENGKNIVCDGGGQIVKMLMEKNLIDEYIISVIPIFLGEGKRLFKGGINTINLKALPSKYFETDLVQLHYIKQ